MKRIIIFLTLICLIGGLTYYKLNNRLHSCETVIEIPDPFSSRDPNVRMMMTKAYVDPDLAKMMPPERAIDLAMEEYQLENLFEIKGGDLKELISNSLEVTHMDGTRLVSITTFAKSEEKAQKLNYAIVKSYQSLRRNSLEKRREESILIFNDKMKIQEDKVEDHKTRLDAIARKYSFTYIPPDTEGVVSEGIVTDDRERLKELPEKMTILGLTEERLRFEKVAEDYEREVVILKAIKEAKHSELETEKSNDQHSFHLHKIGWFPEIETMMEARKEGE